MLTFDTLREKIINLTIKEHNFTLQDILYYTGCVLTIIVLIVLCAPSILINLLIISLILVLFILYICSNLPTNIRGNATKDIEHIPVNQTKLKEIKKKLQESLKRSHSSNNSSVIETYTNTATPNPPTTTSTPLTE